jgi:hypothetical protein
LICHRFYSNLDTPWCRRLLAYYWRRSSFAKQAKMAIHAGAEAPNDEAMAKFVMTLSSFGKHPDDSYESTGRVRTPSAHTRIALTRCRSPTTGTVGCCAYAASGHAAAAPPSVAKNFRRSMWLAM